MVFWPNSNSIAHTKEVLSVEPS